MINIFTRGRHVLSCLSDVSPAIIEIDSFSAAQAPLLVLCLEVPLTALPTFPVSFYINDPIDPQGPTDYYQYIHIDVKRR